MVNIRPCSKIIVTVFALAAQGCAFAPKPPDIDAQQAALERWNRCLQRFEQETHFCDGHRRDVVATFPLHLEHQVNALLTQQTRKLKASRTMETGLEQVFDASDNPAGNPLIESGSGARFGDL